MQQFFNEISPIGQSTIVPPEWRYIKDGLTRNLDTVREYYNTRPLAVKSNHFLLRLLTALGVPMSHHIERYHQIVEAKALSYSMGFKMTSSIYKGGIFKGVFYGENSSEVIVATDEIFNPYDAYKNWESLKPVTCLYHNRSDLKLLLPNGKTTSSDEGISVFAVNIPMLAVQFRAFLEENYANYKQDPNNNYLAPGSHFIHMYVLPGMLESQLDMSLFNRAYNLCMGSPHSTTTKEHPFYITDYSMQVDRMYNEQIKFFKHSNKDFRSILKTFKCISGSFENALRLPKVVSTRQVVWSQVMARIKPLEFMVALAADGGRRQNASDMNDFFRMFKYYSSDNALRHAIPKEHMYDLDRSIINITRSSGVI